MPISSWKPGVAPYARPSIPAFGAGTDYPVQTNQISEMVNAFVGPLAAIPADIVKATMDIVGNFVSLSIAAFNGIIQLPIWFFNVCVQMVTNLTGSFSGGLSSLA